MLRRAEYDRTHAESGEVVATLGDLRRGHRAGEPAVLDVVQQLRCRRRLFSAHVCFPVASRADEVATRHRETEVRRRLPGQRSGLHSGRIRQDQHVGACRKSFHGVGGEECGDVGRPFDGVRSRNQRENTGRGEGHRCQRPGGAELGRQAVQDEGEHEPGHQGRAEGESVRQGGVEDRKTGNQIPGQPQACFHIVDQQRAAQRQDGQDRAGEPGYPQPQITKAQDGGGHAHDQ